MCLQVGLNIRALSACLSTLDKVHFGLVFEDCLFLNLIGTAGVLCSTKWYITHLGSPPLSL